MKKPRKNPLKRNDLPQRKHALFVDLQSAAALDFFKYCHSRIVKDVVSLLRAEKLAKSLPRIDSPDAVESLRAFEKWAAETPPSDTPIGKTKQALRRLAKSEIKRGWTGKVPGFTVDLSQSIENVINRYLKAINFAMLGEYAGPEAREAAEQLNLIDLMPKGSVYGAYLQAIDTQRAYYKDLFGTEPPEMPKSTMDKSFETIQGQADRSVKATLDGYRNRMLDTIEMGLKENRVDILNELMERAHKLDEKTKEKALKQAAKDTVEPAKAKDIKGDIEDAFEKSTADFERMAETTIGLSSAVGTHQAILEIFGTEDNELKACLVSVRDERCCDDCDQFSRNADGSLKIYKINEFKPAGFNFGRKKSEWMLSLPLIHHRCRCSVIYVPPGFTVDKDGTIRPVSKKS